jgi:hypothetical protein
MKMMINLFFNFFYYILLNNDYGFNYSTKEKAFIAFK